MIRVALESGEAGFLNVRVQGHSGYGVHGFDIVCAAVSAIVQTAGLGIERALPGSCVIIDEERADLSIALAPRDDDDPRPYEDAQLILGTMVLGLRDIAAQYPEHVNIFVKAEGK